ncbi:MAG: DUF554 domain-containing protein [Anaerolineales bacterium]|nr:DUF554 domain-containing protein [Anaerolineales bacterium]
MIGTFINVIAIVLGGMLGTLFGQRVPDRLRTVVTQGVGLVILAVGIDMALESENFLVVLGSVLLGGMLGEGLDLDGRLHGLGSWLERAFQRIPFLTRGSFVQGFVTASVVFCVGPMAVLGSIQDGLTGDITLLSIKSVLDGFTSLAFSSALGMGVAFSAVPVFIVQGTFSVGASLFDQVLTSAMLTELTGAGGVLMLGIALTMLEIKALKVVNFLPALLLAPLLAWLAAGLVF